MKTNFAVLFTLLCCALSSTAVFAQTTYVWTGGGDGTNFESGANWGGTLPNPNNHDIAEFDGLMPDTVFIWIGNSGLQFSWTGSFKLQVQSNSVNPGLGANWQDYPAGDVSGVTVPIGTTNDSVFFRLSSTP